MVSFLGFWVGDDSGIFKGLCTNCIVKPLPKTFTCLAGCGAHRGAGCCVKL
jgi:hypothetical protein